MIFRKVFANRSGRRFELIGVWTECGQRNVVVLGGATERDYLCCRRHTRKTATNVRLRDERRRRTVEQRRTDGRARCAFAIDADRLRLINATATEIKNERVLYYYLFILLLFIMIITIVCIYYYACIRIQNICMTCESARARVCVRGKKKKDKKKKGAN